MAGRLVAAVGGSVAHAQEGAALLPEPASGGEHHLLRSHTRGPRTPTKPPSRTPSLTERLPLSTVHDTLGFKQLREFGG